MSNTITLFGIKNCDTVKKARRWLDNANIHYQFHDFRADGTTDKQLSSWVSTIGLDTLINKRSTTWKNLSDSEKDNLNESNAVPLLKEHPTLIKRPLLEMSNGAYVGFKEETYQQLFS